MRKSSVLVTLRCDDGCGVRVGGIGKEWTRFSSDGITDEQLVGES